MQKSHRKDLANHPDPESCACGREAPRRSVDRGLHGPAVELRNHRLRGADTLSRVGQ
jgi:hypothetical protein